MALVINPVTLGIKTIRHWCMFKLDWRWPLCFWKKKKKKRTVQIAPNFLQWNAHLFLFWLNPTGHSHFHNTSYSLVPAGTCARDKCAHQQLALNVHVKHSDLTWPASHRIWSEITLFMTLQHADQHSLVLRNILIKVFIDDYRSHIYIPGRT